MSDPVDASSLIRSDVIALEGYSEIVWVSGPDAVAFLDGLLSQNVSAIEPGTTAPSLLLAPNGKLRATLHVFRGQERIALVCDAGRSAGVAADLTRFKIRVDVAIEAEQRPIYEVWGASLVMPVLVDVGGGDQGTDEVQFALPFRNSAIGRAIVVGATPSDVVLVDRDAVESFRIEIGEPIMGVDLDETTIPQEGADVAGSVDFSKGCYLGQELVARIDSRGHVNRRLCGLVVAGSEIPPIGSDVASEDAGVEKVVGRVTSAARSADRQAIVALAMVRVEVEAGGLVSVGGMAGKVLDLPMRP